MTVCAAALTLTEYCWPAIVTAPELIGDVDVILTFPYCPLVSEPTERILTCLLPTVKLRPAAKVYSTNWLPPSSEDGCEEAVVEVLVGVAVPLVVLVVGEAVAVSVAVLVAGAAVVFVDVVVLVVEEAAVFVEVVVALSLVPVALEHSLSAG